MRSITDILINFFARNHDQILTSQVIDNSELPPLDKHEILDGHEWKTHRNRPRRTLLERTIH